MQTIYTLWLQGYDQAPDIVKTCIERWSKLNPEYRFELLEWPDAQSLLGTYPLKIENVTPQSISDMVRVALLQKTGGVWVDATVFPTKPLSVWFEETIGNAEFFSYSRETKQERSPKDRPISAWFLYATEDSLIIKKLWNEILRYWSVPHYPMREIDADTYYDDPIAFMRLSQETPNMPYPYHWFQHIFAYLVMNDPLFAEIWHSCSYRSMTNQHQIQYWIREGLENENAKEYLTEERIKEIVGNSEMQKLNWRMEFPIGTMEKYSASIL